MIFSAGSTLPTAPTFANPSNGASRQSGLDLCSGLGARNTFSRLAVLRSELRRRLILGIIGASSLCVVGAWSYPEESEHVSGLKQTLQSFDGAQEPDSRNSRLAALFLLKGEAPSPFTPPGRFTSTWEGYLNLKLNDYFVFSAEGRGEVTVQLDGNVVLQASGPTLNGVKSDEVDLKKGPNPIRIVYQSPESGDALFRLYWWNPHQPREPIPPEAFTCDGTDPALVRGEQRRLGRLLFASGRCIKCHLPSQAFPTDAMPELAADSPTLTATGDRLNGTWMAAWLQDPASTRINAQMPTMLHGDETTRAQQARDIASFLATLHTSTSKGDEQVSLKRDLDLIDAGALSFEELGCITCHLLPGNSPLDDDPRIPLEHVRAKWNPDALTQFLQQPSKHYQWTRMPDFQLTKNEAVELASYVLEIGDMPPGSTMGNADPANGRELVRDLGCINCHEIEGLQTRLTAPTLQQISVAKRLKGCLSKPTPGHRSPIFDFTDMERKAVAEFVSNDLPSLERRSWKEFADRQFDELQCIACHARENESDRWSVVMAGQIGAAADEFNDFEEPGSMETDLEADFFDDFEDGDFDATSGEVEDNIHQVRPPLTLAGEKLNVSWMESFIGGELAYKPRARLKARMPAYPMHAEGLAIGASRQHGFSTAPEPHPPLDVEMANVGKELIQMERFGCVSCHAVGDAGALSGASAEAINFAYTHQRLRKHYFDRYILDPQRTLPGTMMPKYLDDQFQSPIRDIMGGDAKKQFEAIWQYMQMLGEQ